MAEQIVHYFQTHLSSPELITFLVSASPVVELRGAIPLAILYYKMNFIKAYVIAITGNLMPIYPLLLLLHPIANLINKIPIGQKLLDFIFRYTRTKGGIVEKYEIMGLLLFVAIPFPGTGAWTGALLAFLFGLNIHLSFMAISTGVFIAGVIVTAFSMLGIWGAIIAGIILLSTASKFMWDRLLKTI